MKQNDFCRLPQMKNQEVYWKEYGIRLSNNTDCEVELSKYPK